MLAAANHLLSDTFSFAFLSSNFALFSLAAAIERGVAQRSCFFGPRGKSGTELVLLLCRVLLLLFFSWCATTLLLIVVVSAPLGLGRLLYSILRVPEKFVHYPLTFAVGGFMAFPALSFIGSVLSKVNYTSIWHGLRQWLGSFRFPPLRKAAVLAATAILWFLVGPMSLGLIYELCFIKTSSWFSGEEDFFDPKDLAMSWVVGTVLLDGWACLCSVSFFTKEFWFNLGNGMLEVEGDLRRARQEAAAANEVQQPGGGGGGAEGENGPVWQGNDGRLARFLSCLKAVLFKFEWETIDHVVLLVECAIPVSKTLCTLLVAPSLCCLLWFWCVDAMIGLDEREYNFRYSLLDIV